MENKEWKRNHTYRMMTQGRREKRDEGKWKQKGEKGKIKKRQKWSETGERAGTAGGCCVRSSCEHRGTIQSSYLLPIGDAGQNSQR
jgi:hypothetical protein